MFCHSHWCARYHLCANKQDNIFTVDPLKTTQFLKTLEQTNDQITSWWRREMSIYNVRQVPDMNSKSCNVCWCYQTEELVVEFQKFPVLRRLYHIVEVADPEFLPFASCNYCSEVGSALLSLFLSHSLKNQKFLTWNCYLWTLNPEAEACNGISQYLVQWKEHFTIDRSNEVKYVSAWMLIDPHPLPGSHGDILGDIKCSFYGDIDRS